MKKLFWIVLLILLSVSIVGSATHVMLIDGSVALNDLLIDGSTHSLLIDGGGGFHRRFNRGTLGGGIH